MTTKEYYAESLSCSFDERGITATKEQIDSVAQDIVYAVEGYSTFSGYDRIPNPIQTELDNLKRTYAKNERQSEELHRKELGTLEGDLSFEYRAKIRKLEERIREMEDGRGR